MKLGMEIGLGPSHIVLDGEWGPRTKNDNSAVQRHLCLVCVLMQNMFDDKCTFYSFAGVF